jgi:FlaA1/EpsC-like NDP-sugar epimerase
MTTDRAVELALEAAQRARGGEVFVFKMPVATLADLVSATIEVVSARNGRDPATIATSSIAPRPGEKAYEELMTEEESTRARDIGEMYAVLPAIEAHPQVIAAYEEKPRSPIGAYRSDTPAPMSAAEVRAVVAEAFAAEDR